MTLAEPREALAGFTTAEPDLVNFLALEEFAVAGGFTAANFLTGLGDDVGVVVVESFGDADRDVVGVESCDSKPDVSGMSAAIREVSLPRAAGFPLCEGWASSWTDLVRVAEEDEMFADEEDKRACVAREAAGLGSFRRRQPEGGYAALVDNVRLKDLLGVGDGEGDGDGDGDGEGDGEGEGHGEEDGEEKGDIELVLLKLRSRLAGRLHSGVRVWGKQREMRSSPVLCLKSYLFECNTLNDDVTFSKLSLDEYWNWCTLT